MWLKGFKFTHFIFIYTYIQIFFLHFSILFLYAQLFFNKKCFFTKLIKFLNVQRHQNKVGSRKMVFKQIYKILNDFGV